MRKSVLCLILLFASTISFCQQKNVDQPLTYQDYMKKSKNQRTAAFILLGSAAIMIAIAAPGDVSFNVLPVLGIGSTASILGSIPLLIASRRNKKKAMKISANFGFRGNTTPTPFRLMNQNSPTITLFVNL